MPINQTMKCYSSPSRVVVAALLPALCLIPLSGWAAKKQNKVSRAAAIVRPVAPTISKSGDGSFASYGIIDERNIFSPDRMPSSKIVQAGPPREAVKPRTTIAVTGTMVKDDKMMVFMQSNDQRFSGVFPPKKRIDTYSIEEIGLKQVVLQGLTAPEPLIKAEGPTEGTGEGIVAAPEPPKRLEVPIGSMIECDDKGVWKLSSVAYNPPPSPSAPSSSYDPRMSASSASYGGGFDRNRSSSGGPGGPGGYGGFGGYDRNRSSSGPGGYQPPGGYGSYGGYGGAPTGGNNYAPGMNGVPTYSAMPGMPAAPQTMAPGGIAPAGAPGVQIQPGAPVPADSAQAAPAPAPASTKSPDEILKEMMARRAAGQ